MIDTDQPFSPSRPASKRKSMQGAWPFVGRQTRMRYGFVICIALSLLLHVLLILAPWSPTMAPTDPGPMLQTPLSVRLEPALPAQAARSPQPTPRPKPKTVQRQRPIIASAKPSPQIPLQIPIQSAEPKPQPEAVEPLDMTAMLNAKRARRAAEQTAPRDGIDTESASQAPTGNDLAMANIKRSLQSPAGGRDGGGVFQIVSKGVRSGQFVFRGWMAGGRNNWHQTINVDAGLNGDIDRALVRRMIELIRSHYPGDFNWDSHRLGRVIVLSARPKDNAELEDFLMQEFFGA